MKIYCMYDKIAETYGQLFTSVNDNTAKRSFMGVLQGNPSEAPDIVLYGIGEYDTENGEIINVEKRVVCLGSDIVNGVKGEVLD